MAIHAAAFAFIPRAGPQRAEAAVATQTITLAFRPHPAATPQPTARPTKSPSRPPVVPSPATQRPASSRPAPLGGRHRRQAPGRVLAVRPKPLLRVPSQAPADASDTQSARAGDGGQAGPSDGDDAGAGGRGDGAPVPCGVVIITELDSRYLRDGSHLAKIRLDITLGDGSVVDDDLGWDFAYAHDSDDPFTPAGKAAETPILLQQPPAGFDLSRQKPATIFAVEHTDRRGYTDLRDCPK